MKAFFWPAYSLVSSIVIVLLVAFRTDKHELAEGVSAKLSSPGAGLGAKDSRVRKVQSVSDLVGHAPTTTLSRPSEPTESQPSPNLAPNANDSETAEARVRAIERLIPLDPEQRRRLLELYERESASVLARGRGESVDAPELATEGQILGEEKLALLEKREAAEAKEVSHLEEKKETAYLTQLLGLSEEQQQKLHSSFESPDRLQEMHVAYALSELNVSGDQSLAVEKLLRTDYESEVRNYIDAAGGPDRLPENLTYSLDGARRQPDESAIAELLRNAELKKLLTEEQMNRYSQLEEEERPVN